MRLRTVVIVAAALVVAAAVSGYFVDARFREWNRRVDSVLEFAEGETARANSAETAASDQKARSDEIVAAARARVPEIRDRIVTVREQAPPDSARDSIIDDLTEVVDSITVAYDSTSAAFVLLRSAYGRLLTVNDSLTIVLKDRPKPRSRWAPTFTVGAFAGVCTNGKFCAGVGPGISFEIKIPTPW